VVSLATALLIFEGDAHHRNFFFVLSFLRVTLRLLFCFGTKFDLELLPME